MWIAKIVDDRKDIYTTFWTHLEELRNTLLKMLTVIASGILVCFFFYNSLINILIAPLNTKSDLPLYEERLEYNRISNFQNHPQKFILKEGDSALLDLSEGVTSTDIHTYEIAPQGKLMISHVLPKQQALVILNPLEGFLTALKVSIWVGVVVTSPLWLWMAMQFIIPALRFSEKRLLLPFLITSLVFIFAGCCFTFFVTIPIANAYFSTFNQSVGVNLWSLSHYMDYTLFLMMANGLAFELSVIGIFGVHLGVLSVEMLVRQRRVAIVLAFVIGALLTPPDVLTQLMLAIPLIILYEGLIVYARYGNHFGIRT